MQVEVMTVNSFAINNTGGNPAGVVLEADRFTREQKQEIASKAGLSETAFVSKSSVSDIKLEFFTPTRQIPHCGHATIATFSYLKSIGIIKGNTSSKETIDGTRKIFFQGDEAFMEQRAPQRFPIDDKQSILKSLGIDTSALKNDATPVIINTGNSFVLVQLKNESDLKKLRPDFNAVSEISEKHNCIGYYVFTVSANLEVQTRMFAPYYGIEEESATGMAAGPLACFLYNEYKKTDFLINQGKYMSPPSESRLKAKLEVKDNAIKSLLVGGGAYVRQVIEVQLGA